LAMGLGVRRARDAGLPAALGVFPTLVCIGDANKFFLFALGLPPSAYSAGSGFSLPVFILTGLLCAAALCLPKTSFAGGSERRFP
jgi:hypothetical protein